MAFPTAVNSQITDSIDPQPEGLDGTPPSREEERPALEPSQTNEGEEGQEGGPIV